MSRSAGIVQAYDHLVGVYISDTDYDINEPRFSPSFDFVEMDVFNNTYVGCVGNTDAGGRGDYEDWRIRYLDEETATATLRIRSDIAEDIDTDDSYQFVALLEDCGGRFGVGFQKSETTPSPPTAQFSFSPQQPVIGESVTFDASDSEDPDGEIAEFEWDFDSDGDTDTTGEEVTHTFEEGGDHTVTLTVTDDDGETDSAEDVVTVWIPVTIDIKPGGDSNPINTESLGEIPVAILQTDDFDPTSRVDVDTVQFGAPNAVDDGGGATPLRGGQIEDVDGDGDDDLVLHFATQETEFDGDESEGKLIGETDDGAPLFGTDEVEFVGR